MENKYITAPPKMTVMSEEKILTMIDQYTILIKWIQFKGIKAPEPYIRRHVRRVGGQGLGLGLGSVLEAENVWIARRVEATYARQGHRNGSRPSRTCGLQVHVVRLYRGVRQVSGRRTGGSGHGQEPLGGEWPAWGGWVGRTWGLRTPGSEVCRH